MNLEGEVNCKEKEGWFDRRAQAPPRNGRSGLAGVQKPRTAPAERRGLGHGRHCKVLSRGVKWSWSQFKKAKYPEEAPCLLPAPLQKAKRGHGVEDRLKRERN